LLPVDATTALLRGTVNGQAMLTQTVADLSPIAWLAGATLAFAHVVPLALVAVLARFPWRPIRVDVRVIAPLLALSACVMTWSLHGADWSAVGIMLIFGLIGYAMIRGGFDRSLMFFAFAVEQTFEENIRRTLLLTRGDATAYLQRPISAVLLLAGILLFVGVRWWRRRHRLADVDSGSR
jgi:TctA family transporter